MSNHWKKILAAGVAGAFLLTAAPVVAVELSSPAYAAKGGAKFSAPKSAPKPAPKAAAPSGNTQKADKPNNKAYQPSKDAKDLQKDAPAAKSNAAAGTMANAANANTGSRFGNALRNIGLLAGGMMLGGLLASLFGMEGFMSDLMGILMNVVLFGAAFMAIRWLWGKFRGRGRSQENVYRQDFAARQPERKAPPIVDIQPPTTDYDPRTTANKYRNR